MIFEISLVNIIVRLFRIIFGWGVDYWGSNWDEKRNKNLKSFFFNSAEWKKNELKIDRERKNKIGFLLFMAVNWFNICSVPAKKRLQKKWDLIISSRNMRVFPIYQSFHFKYLSRGPSQTFFICLSNHTAETLSLSLSLSLALKLSHLNLI